MKKSVTSLGVLLLLLGMGCGNQKYLSDESVIANSQSGTDTDNAGDPTKWRCGPDGSLCQDEETDDVCVPLNSCEEGGLQCGKYTDNCGGEALDCGDCNNGLSCIDNKCVSPCDPNPCKGPDNICTPTAGGYYCHCTPGFELDEDGECQKMSTVTIRLMAANITSGNKQSYLGPGIRMFMGLKPDIVMIQEFNYDKKLDSEYKFEDIDDFVYGVFGPEFTYHRGSDSEQIPNGIISRYPIKESGTWVDNQVGNRSFEWARIDIPGDADLWAVSVHLLTTSGKQPAQAKELIDYINGVVPKGDYVAIGGDFNTTKHSASALTKLNNVVVTQMSDGYAMDQNGDETSNRNRTKPYDGVYVSKDLHYKEVPVTIEGHDYEYRHGLVFDSRVFTPLSAVAPVRSGDSSAENMQHMPVIRDFKLW